MADPCQSKSMSLGGLHGTLVLVSQNDPKCIFASFHVKADHYGEKDIHIHKTAVFDS